MTDMPTDNANSETPRSFAVGAHLFAFLVGSLSGTAFTYLFGGGWFGLLLAYTAPILLYLAGLGGGRSAAVTATAFGILVVLLKMGGPAAGIYALMIAVPAMIVSRVTLARVHDTWLDAGLLLQVALAMGIVLMLGTAIMLELSGVGLQALLDNVCRSYQAALLQLNEGKMPVEQINEAVAMFSSMIPSLVAISWFFVHLIGYGVAQWVLTETNYAKRPALNTAQLALPPYAAGAFAACVLVASFADGNVSLVLGAVAALLGTGFMLVGLVIIHRMIDRFCISKNIGGFGRVAIFGFYYIVLMAVQLPLLLALLLGLADPWVKFRNKLNLTV